MKHLLSWAIASFLAIGLGAIAATGYEDAEADKQDAEAISSRDWAGQRVCGPQATPEWLDDKTLRCLRNVPAAN
ncbi:hypothetical protein C8245_23045 [Paracidovorax avenae]|uniref:hypothetical protein n=1 Tax=Paracidovorax avenae TaxID=80867 RepID=UPI000D2249ED|nr:hypothetical protein [Paracidovorax avenae]AVS68154.1 hypothetical protein C8245_23045 [Paracidovorax avenae]